MREDGGRISPEALEAIRYVSAAGLKPEWVYLAQVSGSNLYKIGTSSKMNPWNRVSAIGKQPVLLVALPYAAGAKAERAYHRHFRDKWVAGEWFNLSQDDVGAISAGTLMLALEDGTVGCNCH